MTCNFESARETCKCYMLLEPEKSLLQAAPKNSRKTFDVYFFLAMEQKRLTVKSFYNSSFTTAEICKQVAKVGISRRFVYRTVKRLRETGSVGDRPRSGRPRTIRTKERVKRVREKFEEIPVDHPESWPVRKELAGNRWTYC